MATCHDPLLLPCLNEEFTLYMNFMSFYVIFDLPLSIIPNLV